MGEPFYVPSFADFTGPWRDAFAWLPTRMFTGQWVWLRKYRRRPLLKKPHLDGPDWQGWFNGLPGDYAEGLR